MARTTRYSTVMYCGGEMTDKKFKSCAPTDSTLQLPIGGGGGGGGT